MKLTKSIILPLLIAASVCAGCSSVDDFNPTEAPLTYITFNQPVVTFEGVGAQTRSELIKTADLTEFTVCGFCVPQNISNINSLDYSQAGASWSGKSKFCRPNVFDEGTAIVRKNRSSWEYDKVKQWVSPFEKADEANKKFASDAKFTFIAWANGDFRLQGFSTEYAPKLEFYMPFSGGTENNPVVCDHNEAKDALIAARYDHEKIEGSVPLHFQHILTAIRFRIANHSNETLTIKSMSFTGQFFGKATFTYETSVLDQDVDQNSNLYWGRFNIIDQTNPDVIPANTQGRIIGVTEDNRDGLSILLLPDPDVDPTDSNESRNALGKNKKIQIYYSLTDKDGKVSDYEAAIDVSLSYIPEQSTRHTATFNFLGKNQFYVIFKPDGDVWENGSDDTITIN